jgi:hypothetical protein
MLQTWQATWKFAAYLDLLYNLPLARVDISAVHYADDIRLGALHERDGRPQDTLSAAACIAFRLEIRVNIDTPCGETTTHQYGWKNPTILLLSATPSLRRKAAFFALVPDRIIWIAAYVTSRMAAIASNGRADMVVGEISS